MLFAYLSVNFICLEIERVIIMCNDFQPAQQPSQPAIMQAVSPPISGQYQPTNQQSTQPPTNFTTADFQVSIIFI